MSYQFLVLLGLSLLSLSNTQYIATSYSYDKVLTYTYQYLQTALNQNLLKELQTIEIAEFKAGELTVNEVKPTSVNALFTGSFGNMGTNLYLFSPNKLIISYTFSYTKGETKKENVQLVFSVYMVKAKLSVDNFTPVFDVSVIDRAKDFKVYEANSGDNTILEQGFFDAFNKKETLNAAVSIVEQIADSIKTCFTDYYKNLYANKESFKFTLSKPLGGFEAELNLKTFMGFCKDVTQSLESAICYYDGSTGTPESGLEEEALSREEFKTPVDDYFTFLNYKLFNTIFKDKEPMVTLTKDSFEGLSFGFTVKDIKAIFKIPEGFVDEDEYQVQVYISKFTFNPNGEFQAHLSNLVKIKDTERAVEFQNDVTFKVNGKKTSMTSFDLCGTEGEVNNISPKGVVLDEVKAKAMVQEVLSKISDNNTCLTDNGINVKNYYRYLDNIIIGANGVYLEGKHIYF